MTGLISSYMFFKLSKTCPGEGIIMINLLKPVCSRSSKLPASVENNQSISLPYGVIKHPQVFF